MTELKSMSREELIARVRQLESQNEELQEMLREESLPPVLAKLVDQLPCPLFVKNEQLEVNHVNRALRQIVPLSARQLDSKTMGRIFSRCTLERGRESDLSVLADGIPQEREEYFSGQSIRSWFHLHKFRLTCPVSGEKFVLTLIRDTSELKSMERHLMRTQRMAKLGSWSIRRPGNNLTCTEGIYALFGYRPGEIIPSLELFRTHAHPEDLPWLAETVNAIKESDRPITGEFRIFKVGGEMAWLRMHVSPTISEIHDRPDLDGTFQDITEQKLLLERHKAFTQDIEEQRNLFNTMADNLTDMLWAKDLDNRYLFGNRALREQLLHSDDILIRGKQDIFFAERQREMGKKHTFGECCMNSDDVILKTKRPGTFTEDGLIDGEYTMLQVHKSPLFDQSGILIGTVGTARNITEQKQAERELLKAREAAEDAARAKASFLANTGHEIRTPLNGMIGLLDLTLNSGLSSEQRNNLIQARHSASRLHLMLNNIIECADLEQGRTQMNVARFDLKETVGICCVRIAGQCQGKSIILDTRVDDDLSAPVLGDQTKVVRILDLILDNAVKFTDRGKISVTVERSVSAPEMVVFRVRDTGCGIPETSLSKIFSSFTQVEDGLERVHGGAGLGLAIVRELVELLRGTVKATPHADGTEFEVRLPLATSGLEAECICTAPATAAPLEVLVVDDDMVNRMVLDKIIQKEHHHVQTASNGKEAVQKFSAGAFDVIFMDIQMPVMNGIDATGAIRALEAQRSQPRTPIIAVTANALPNERDQFLQAGMDELMLKPVSRDELLHAVREIVRRKDDPSE